jgi:MYXO-CTERM domain-containing protein
MMNVKIPSLRITAQDATKIRAALGTAPIATIRVDGQRGLGTSVGGRVYLDATDPAQIGVSVAHWDPMITPHLLMHPTLANSQALDLTVSLMHDLGWRPFRCGDGVAEGTEECDDGQNGSGSCAADCTLTGGARDGGATIADAGDASQDASGGVGDATPIVPPPNRFLDASDVPAPNFHGIVWAPKHGGCSCRVGEGGATREQPVGLSGAAVALAAFLRRRFGVSRKKPARTER